VSQESSVTRRLFEALQSALEGVFDPHLHDECKERLKDAVDELAKADASRLRDAPEAEVDMHAAKRILRARRERQPLVPPSGYSHDASERYDRFVVDRDATDLIEQLLAEVEAYRKLAGVTV
jgi:hypothetical protein